MIPLFFLKWMRDGYEEGMIQLTCFIPITTLQIEEKENTNSQPDLIYFAKKLHQNEKENSIFHLPETLTIYLDQLSGEEESRFPILFLLKEDHKFYPLAQ